ncbi:MAG: hypothetical protein M3Q10_18355 [Chloroflexota bacterium]|nr:hypothetical protein [Chloroflexota bacterium]
MGNREQPINARGHTFLHATEAGKDHELNTRTEISVGEDECAWEVGTLVGGRRPERIQDASPQVRRYLRRVFAAMNRATPKPARPVPKPTSGKKALALPPSAPVPCPICGGEPWHTCPLCDGEGVVTVRQAEQWRADHDI